MASLTITVPDAVLPRVIAAIRSRHYDITDGLGDAQAGRAVIARLLRREVALYERSLAEIAAADAADQAEQTAYDETGGIT